MDIEQKLRIALDALNLLAVTSDDGEIALEAIQKINSEGKKVKEFNVFVSNGWVGGKEHFYIVSPIKDEPYFIPAKLIVEIPDKTPTTI